VENFLAGMLMDSERNGLKFFGKEEREKLPRYLHAILPE
jgi:hypothetical protein